MGCEGDPGERALGAPLDQTRNFRFDCRPHFCHKPPLAGGAVGARTQQCVEWEPGRKVYLHAALQVLLACFHALHATWVLRDPVTDLQVAEYSRHVAKFAQAWRALSWKGTVWVHWVVAHSAHLLTLHGTISAFSSIPSEHKHKTFNVDVRHSFAGGRDRKRHLTAGGLAHVVEKNALDVGLALEAAKRRRVV